MSIKCGFGDYKNKISLKEYYINTYYDKTVPIYLIKSDVVKLETYHNGRHIKIIDFSENKLSEDVYYSLNYLRTLPSITSDPSIASYNHDIIFNICNYLNFLKKYDIELKIRDIMVIANVPNLDNAYWNGSYLTFGGGCSGHHPLTSSCIVAHELTHCLIQEKCDLEYQGQSGALNESYADIFGVMFEDYIKTHYHSLGWEIGLECNMKLRDMKFPNLCNQPETINDPLFYKGYQDNGGVHINSGIINHIFVCMTENMNMSFAFNVFLKTLYLLNSKSNFNAFKAKMITVIDSFEHTSETMILKDILNKHI